MHTLRRGIVCPLLLTALFACAAPLVAQDTGSTADRPFVFFTPGLAIMDRDTSHDQFFNSIDTTLVVPFSPNTSAVGTCSLQFRDKLRWTAVGNYDWFMKDDTTLRLSGGLFSDELGARVTAFQQGKRLGTGLRLGVVSGDIEVGGFVTMPFAWGFPLRKQSMGERIKGREKVTDLGAATALSLSLRGGEPDLGTEPEYFYPRSNADWRRFGQGPQGQGATAASLSDRLFQSWVAETGGPVRSSAAIADNTVYFGSDDGYLYALDLETGELRWRYRIGSPIASSPAVTGGKVFVGCDDGSVHCFRAEADKQLSDEQIGRQVWRFRTNGPVVGSPLVTVSGLAVFGSADGTLYAIDAQTARPVWTHFTDGPITASPVKSEQPLLVVSEEGANAVKRDVLYCASEDGHVYALGERDGQLLWRVNTGAPIRMTPVVWAQRVIVANDDGRVLALQGRDGTQAWAQTVPGSPGGSPALRGKMAVVPLRSGRLVGLDLSGGEEVWAAELPSRIESSPIATGESRVYVGTVDGHLYAVDTPKGEIRWNFLTAGPITASPAVAHGRLVCGSQDGAIYGFAGQAPAEGVATHSLAANQRVAYAKPDAAAPLQKPEPVPGLAPIKPAWAPPPGWQQKPPSTTVREQPGVIDVPQPADQSPVGLRMQLISEPSDAAELPIQLTNQRSVVVSWGTTAAVAEVDGETVRNRDGAIAASRSFNSDGTYPVTMIVGKDTPDEQIACRLVIVDTSDEPAARREVAFSPDGDGIGDTIAFRVLAEGAGDGIAARIVDVRDADGHAVRTWTAPGAGETAFVWDGTDLAGDRVPSGMYDVIYFAKDETGNVKRMTQRVLLMRAGERMAAG